MAPGREDDPSYDLVTEAEAPQLSWWARMARWRQTSEEEARHSERGVLNLLRSKWEVADVPVAAAPEQTMHTISGGRPDGPPLVLMPGYGAGSGFYFRNLDGLARAFKVYAVDWLGTGLSGRPPFTPTDRRGAEDFFLESLAAWRRAVGLGDGGKFVLVGHSLGGYLAASYALRHPDHVEHLVLVGPAGIPAKPEGWESRFLSDSWSLRAQLFKLAAGAWAAGVTPGGVVRALGPLGPGLIDKYVAGRFSVHGQPLTPAERGVFRDYFYHIAAARGSGEHALRHILAPGAWAHAPLAARLAELKVPVTFIYGQQDWMDPRAGRAVAADLDRQRQRKVPSDHEVREVPDAGHFVFIEQPQDFNAALLRSLAPYLPAGLADRLAAEEERSGALARAAQAEELRRRQLEEERRAAEAVAGAPPTQAPPGQASPGA